MFSLIAIKIIQTPAGMYAEVLWRNSYTFSTLESRDAKVLELLDEGWSINLPD